MTKKQIEKQRKKLPAFSYTDKLKQLENELDCREMINSILVYGNVDSDIDSIYNNNFLIDYRDTLSEERIKELIKEQQADLKKSKISIDSYTDGEGVTYNTVDWYDETDLDEKKEESAEVNTDMNFETIQELAQYIADHYTEITGTPFNSIFNSYDLNNEDLPIFNQEVIDKDWKKMEAFIDKYGSEFKKDDLLDEIDTVLINKRNNKNLNESENTNSDITYYIDSLNELKNSFKHGYGSDDEEIKQEVIRLLDEIPDGIAMYRVNRETFSGWTSHGSYSDEYTKLIAFTKDGGNWKYNGYQQKDTTDAMLSVLYNSGDFMTRESAEELKRNMEKDDKSYHRDIVNIGTDKWGNPIGKSTNRVTNSIKTESLGDRYQVWQKYFEDGEPAKAEYVQCFNTFEEASKFADGLNEDPNCSAWIVDTMQKESKELEQGLIFDTITDLANYIAKHYEEITDIPLKDIFNNSEDEPIFNQDVIDKGWDKIKAFIDLYGSNFKRDDLLDEIDDALINERYDQSLYESKELRKYNSRLYGIYDTEKEEYIKTGTLEEMKKEVEVEKEDIEDKKEEPKEDKKDININITVKNESLNDKNKILSKVFANYPDISEEDEDYLNGLSLEELIIELRSRGWEDLMKENKEIKKVKTESLVEESINPIINPNDIDYYDDHLWIVYLYPGAGVDLIPYYVYADYEQEAFDILLPYLLENAPGLVYDVSDLEDDDLDNYMSIDGNYYLDYNTRIEEIEGEEKEKIEKEFFKDYKEENN